MIFRAAMLSLLAVFASAEENKIPMEGSIPVKSNAGQELLMKATVVEEARILNNNNNNDYSWMAGYSIHYTGCTSLVQVAGQQGNNNNNKNQDGGMIYTQHLVRFSICPVDDCSSSCSGGGQYVVNMADFVDLYTEAKLSEQERLCEEVREECYCENANDDQACENECYADKDMDACVNYEGENDEFEVQRYLECQEMENNGNNNNNNNNYYYGNDYYYGSLYVGPYCPDGKNIYLGVFYDQGCSAKADVAQYSTRMGSELPFSSTSLVKSGDCIACTVSETNDNGEVNVEYQEICTNLHGEAAKCEDGMSITYPDTSACDYIKNVLPRLDAASRSISGGSKTTYATKGKTARAFAVIFAFTTVLFAAYAYFLYRKIKRGVVALASQGN